MEIRNAEKADLKKIMQLSVKLLNDLTKIRNFYKPPEEFAGYETGKVLALEKMLSNDKFRILVLSEKDEIRGYIIAKIANNPFLNQEKLRGEIIEFYALEEYREWGKALIEKSLIWLRENKIRRAVGKFDTLFEWTKKLYETAGFHQFQNEYEIILK